MRYALLTLTAVLVLSGAVLMGAARADGPSPEPSPSVSPTPTPTAVPSDAKLRRFCLESRARAVKAWKRYAKARTCFGKRPLVRVAQRPLCEDSAQVWLERRSLWIKQRKQLERLTTRLRYQMTHPGGSSNGVRWKPLMRWVGWPEYHLPTLTRIVMRESSGRPNALNPSSGAAGLLQFMPQWYRGYWGHPPFNPFDPETNLRVGWWLYQRQGWSPWAATY